MDKGKLRRFLFMQDKQNGMSPPGQSMPVNKTTPNSMQSGLPNPMGMTKPSTGMSKPIGNKMPSMPKMTLPNPTAAPSIVGQQPKMPKMAKFAKTRNYFKK